MSKMSSVINKKAEAKRDSSVSYSRKAKFLQSFSAPIERTIQLQGAVGNHATQSLINNGIIQPKLKIGIPNDKYERVLVILKAGA